MTTEALDFNDRALKAAIRAVRVLPSALRREFRTAVGREVVTPLGRQVQLAAGSSATTFSRAFRNRGVSVEPGEEPMLRIGGPEPFGSHGGRMRDITWGAEFGGSHRKTTYQMKGRKSGRRRAAAHEVRRSTTVGFGRHQTDGAFIVPTLRREIDTMSEAYLALLARVTDEGWGDA